MFPISRNQFLYDREHRPLMSSDRKKAHEFTVTNNQKHPLRHLKAQFSSNVEVNPGPRKGKQA